MVEGILKRNKWRWTDSRSPNFLLELRYWDYGVFCSTQRRVADLIHASARLLT